MLRKQSIFSITRYNNLTLYPQASHLLKVITENLENDTMHTANNTVLTFYMDETVGIALIHHLSY